MIYKTTIDGIELDFDDADGLMIVSIEFEIEYELIREKMLGIWRWASVLVHGVEPVRLTSGKFKLYCRDRVDGVDKELLDQLGCHIRNLENEAETGELSVELIEKG